MGLTEKNIKKSFKEFDIQKGKDKIPGGKADNMTCEQIAKKHGVSIDKIKKEVDIGTKHEMEHTDDKGLAKEIALDHLMESPKYYHELKEMEKKEFEKND